ncbi:PREDICTED: beta-hexosaminidase 1 isoform X2 [Tarenaya hassleriana]|uniref:beta-hexosaminidase 1 isoform X2 n=1 Tax=Tarenaya hassleriana TaxID=28532 RepID=UPI00053C2181|nr:PREDICTED: beta-hexosaminidase 1 isoform X2 [Tarenaya hassleriana]
MAVNLSTIHTLFVLLSLWVTSSISSPSPEIQGDSLPFIWPLPAEFSSGDETLSVDPAISLIAAGNGGNSPIVKAAFGRYVGIIFKHVVDRAGRSRFFRGAHYDITSLKIVVHSDSEELQLGVDEGYTLMVSKNNYQSIVGGATIEANTVYGALRGLETFSQLCAFDYLTKSVQIYKAPWYIQDQPRFKYRGLLIDTSRHFLPLDVIKQIIESMSFAKFNVLHWHIVDEESFPVETPTYPNLWKGAYSKWEKYTVEDAYEIVRFAKMRGINVMAEIDVPGHAESGTGYPDLWPSPSCREPLDVSKNFTFDVISGILGDLRKIFPFELFHLGGDEVNTDCWKNTTHVNEWLRYRNITTKDAYEYFVLRAQQIAISKNWTPVNWEETFKSFGDKLDPRTVVHNWLENDICPKAVAKGFRCIFSYSGYWYLDHLDVPWDAVYRTEPLKGINDTSLEKLVIGGEVCMWGETADSSDVLQTIWPRAAAAAERLWSKREAVSKGNITLTALPRLHYFRCLLNQRGVPAAPVDNKYGRRPPSGPGSCYVQ